MGLYWSYCIFWGIKGAITSKTSDDYFIAGRSIGTWVFVLAATATSFSGWTFVGHPGKILTDGLPYAFARHLVYHLYGFGSYYFYFLGYSSCGF